MNYRLKLGILTAERHDGMEMRGFRSDGQNRYHADRGLTSPEFFFHSKWSVSLPLRRGLMKTVLSNNTPVDSQPHGRGCSAADLTIRKVSHWVAKKCSEKRKTAEDLFSFPLRSWARFSNEDDPLTLLLQLQLTETLLLVILRGKNFLSTFEVFESSAKYLTAAGNAKSISSGMTFKNAVKNVVLCNWNGQN